MDIFNTWISAINDVLWSYILIIMLLGCAIWFTFKTRFVQFRMIKEMIKLLGDSTGKSKNGEKHISSFQAFAVSLASRVGNGNCGWRSGSCILDVDHCFIGSLQRLRRIDISTII